MPRLQQHLTGLLLALVMVGCQQRNSAVPATAKASTETVRSTDATTPTLSPADLPAASLQINVPKASYAALADPQYRQQRLNLVNLIAQTQDGAPTISDQRVVAAMRLVPRHEFVPRSFRHYAYLDQPLEIGYDQTISQPYIVALMTQLLQPKPEDRILEIGTGSGYQAAVLALLVKEVYTIEIVDALAKRAAKDLRRLGYENVNVLSGDGYRGWPDKAPFDGVMITAAPETIPQPLVDQLKMGGRLVVPVGPRGRQELVVIRKTEKGVYRETVIPVLFVPMTGEIQKEGKAK